MSEKISSGSEAHSDFKEIAAAVLRARRSLGREFKLDHDFLLREPATSDKAKS